MNSPKTKQRSQQGEPDREARQFRNAVLLYAGLEFLVVVVFLYLYLRR